MATMTAICLTSDQYVVRCEALAHRSELRIVSEALGTCRSLPMLHTTLPAHLVHLVALAPTGGCVVHLCSVVACQLAAKGKVALTQAPGSLATDLLGAREHSNRLIIR